MRARKWGSYYVFYTTCMYYIITNDKFVDMLKSCMYIRVDKFLYTLILVLIVHVETRLEAIPIWRSFVYRYNNLCIVCT